MNVNVIVDCLDVFVPVVLRDDVDAFEGGSAVRVALSVGQYPRG